MDNATLTLLRYEWTLFLRNRFQLLILTMFFLFGMYAIYYGYSEIQVQRDTIREVSKLEEEEFRSYQASFKQEISSLEEERNHDIAARPAYAWFRHGYHAILHPHDYASLAIGQRDLFRYYYRLTGMSLHYQLFENELANPVNLLAGNFDLSFVIVYLLPLLVIAFCYGLYSAEKENGTLPLLHIQPLSLRHITLVRLCFYFLLLTGLSLFMVFIGLAVSGNPFHETNLLAASTWILGVILYIVFWFSLMFLIISIRKNSAFNAMSAAGCWLLFLIIVPAVLNVIVTTKYPLSSTALAGLSRRTSLENENDQEEARAVIMEFLEHKPELAPKDGQLNTNLLPKAYAAFTSLKDIHSKEQVVHYNAQVMKRNQWTSGLHWLSPAVNMQNILAHISQTDLGTFMRFQKALEQFHEDITEFYFVRLFHDRPITLEDYAQLPSFEMEEDKGIRTAVFSGLSKITLAATLAFVIGFLNMKGDKI